LVLQAQFSLVAPVVTVLLMVEHNTHALLMVTEPTAQADFTDPTRANRTITTKNILLRGEANPLADIVMLAAESAQTCVAKLSDRIYDL